MQDLRVSHSPHRPANDAPARRFLPPYHVFKHSGECFAYFLERDCAFHIDRPTYDLLARALKGSFAEAADRLLQEGKYDTDTVASIMSEVSRLQQAGFFRPVRNWLSTAEKEQALTHRYTTPWTRLELALAESCNLACKYCYCSAVRDMPNQGLMTEEVAQTAIDWLFKASGDAKELSLTLFGGEPLLNKPVFKSVMDYSDALAKKHGKRIHYSMTTNGTLIDDMVIHYIKKHNFGLMVSLDGPPEIHNAQCPTQDGGPSFDMAAKGIKRLMKRRKRVTVRCTVTNAMPRLLDLVRFFEDFGFTRIVLGAAMNPVSPSSFDCDQEVLEDFENQQKEHLIPWMLGELAEGRIPSWFPYASLIKRIVDTQEKPVSMFRCGACRGTSTVGADGRMYPCHRFVGMRNWVCGDISNGPDIECAKEFWRRYDDAVGQTCSQCWARRACNRPCPWQIAQEDGSFHMQGSWKCDKTRSAVEEGMMMH